MNRPQSHPIVGVAVSPATAPAYLPPLPICARCNRNPYGCVCNVEDIDVPSVEEMKRSMPGLFEPRGWELAERSALGMAVKL